MWLNELKIAVCQEDIKMLDKLLSELPQLTNKEELNSAVILLDQAKQIMQEKKIETFKAMQQIKKNIDFLNSTTAETTAKFDITS